MTTHFGWVKINLHKDVVDPSYFAHGLFINSFIINLSSNNHLALKSTLNIAIFVSQ